jgi:2-haloacid dehalogenase
MRLMSDHLDPQFVTFDCYGTLIWFQMSQLAREILGPRIGPALTPELLALFGAYRYDEACGDWKPYRQVIRDALRRTLGRHGLAYEQAEADRLYDAIGTWGPHPDVPAGLARLAQRHRLVILSNAANDQIPANVARLGAPFHAVYTAEQARAYKPRLAAFEYMLDHLGCGPRDIAHVSSNPRYDLMPARDLGIRDAVYVNRGFEPSSPGYGYREIASIAELPALFGM